jgi:hypothetical protein
MNALTKLNEMERLAYSATIKHRPECFEMLATKHTDKTANGLTKAVIRWIELHGGQAERINTQGTYIKGKIITKGFYGQVRTEGKYIPTTGTKGSADISAVINGKSWKIEVKIGADKQSENQRRYQESIERAGGKYIIIRNLDEFVEVFNGSH